jgi:hypothetical protein
MDLPVDEILKVSAVCLFNGIGLEDQQFQDYLSEYKIIVYVGFSPYRLTFTGNSLCCMMRTWSL